MYIKNLQINNFGNINDKKIEFQKGLNLVRGANESREIYYHNVYKMYAIRHRKEQRW